jgi:predicted phosphodiesterase
MNLPGIIGGELMGKEVNESGRLLVTGDTHGEQNRLIFMSQWIQTGDILFEVGDFGYLFRNDKTEQNFLNDIENFLEKKDAYIVFVDGNHDNHRALQELPVENWCEAAVHKLRPRIIHVLRGEILHIRGKKIFCFGGAFSIDRAYRELNRSYWDEELPTDNDYHNGNRNLEAAGHEVDYILTHTCPLSMICLLNAKHSCIEELPLQNYLDQVREQTSYKSWFFGHWHVDRYLGKNLIAIFYDLIDMESGEILNE